MPDRPARPLLPLAALLLAGCGVIPTPVVALRDTTVPLANTFITQGKVVYVNQDQLEGVTLPAALRGLTIRGNALYNASGGDLGTVKLYVRSTLDGLDATCSTVPFTSPTMYACDPAGESAQAIGTVTVQAGTKVPFTLSGAALDAAARTGRGYFGFQVVTGTALNGESVNLTSVTAQARL
ncbi:hypothetical protein HNQ07_000490 [Deinococcus metalli]|uniref:Lipoprotein n=1 Tax=Deinococcus metalli TaxID=1141878 RepID=A0A7W8KDH7_9DEIO|nr:hypothetical protein [Deinococcus metalli]MBB5375046.1 hypothetical protein [Deinococcus metalli]GHF31864.1 hypothetical protein GCM10017781_05520 [Deinococcus metalli]